LISNLAEEAALDKFGIIYKVSFVILPLVNPDGYEFSRSDSKNKMWRKTRRPVANNCFGVDGNRNFDIRWSQGDREFKACNEVYKGPTAFSEPETKIVRDIMNRLRKRCLMYISVHTFGNSILYPWGFTGL
jgi:hypothetical protein